MSIRWTIVPLLEVVERVGLKNKDLLDRVLTVSAIRGLVVQETYFSKRVASSNLANYLVIKPGTFVYNKSYSEAAPFGVAISNSSPEPGVVSPLYFAFKPKQGAIDQSFLEYVLNSSNFHIQLAQFIKQGGRAHGGINVSTTDYFSLKIPQPDLAEQRRIVDIVSSVDAYIDALQQQADSARKACNAVLDSLLEQVSGSSIEHSLKEIAVERGLIGGPFGSSLGAKDYKEFGIPVIRGKNIPQKSEFIDGPFVYVSEQKAHELSRNIAQPGDLIATQRGTLGQVGIVPSTPFVDYVISQSQMRLRPKGDLALTKFLYLQMSRQDFVNEILSREVSTANPHINLGIFAELKLKLPPLTEQKRIVEIVSSMDDVIQSTELAVTDATNLRSGLLSDLLSGEHQIPESYDRFLKAA